MCWLENQHVTLVCSDNLYSQQSVHLLFSSNISGCLMGELWFPFRRLSVEGLAPLLRGPSIAQRQQLSPKHIYRIYHRAQGLGQPQFQEPLLGVCRQSRDSSWASVAPGTSGLTLGHHQVLGARWQDLHKSGLASLSIKDQLITRALRVLENL